MPDNFRVFATFQEELIKTKSICDILRAFEVKN